MIREETIGAIAQGCGYPDPFRLTHPVKCEAIAAAAVEPEDPIVEGDQAAA